MISPAADRAHQLSELRFLRTRVRDLEQQLITKEHILYHQRQTTEAQDQFVRLASHQMQHPLGVIRGFLELYGTTKEERYKDIAIEHVDQLSQLIRSLLQYMRLSNGEVKVTMQVQNIRQIVEDTVQPFFDANTRHRLLFHPGYERFVLAIADPVYLTEALKTLLENAKKYTPRGHTIWVELTETEDDVQIHVGDTGPGIPSHKLKDVFEPFARGTEAQNGAGLGLSLCQQIMELHNGTVTVVSELGRGTRFTLTLPRVK